MVPILYHKRMRFIAIKRLLAVGGLFVGIACLLMVAEPTLARAITKGYSTSDKQLLPGMVASLVPGSGAGESTVERAAPETQDKIVGIATTVNESLITVASGSSQVFVESEGAVSAYVTDVNGTPKKGDMLTVSPLKGILMKAEETTGSIVAVAEEDFSADKSETYDLTGDGPKTAHVQKIRVNLDRSGTGSRNAADVKSTLDKLGKVITGREIGTFRVAMALVVFLLVMITEGAILYGTISSAITSLGRNPMAHGVIRRELFRVIFVVTVVLLVGLGAIYGILWA